MPTSAPSAADAVPADPPFLAGLDAVAWGDLSHAYGPATDVPGLLRSLFAGSAEEARELGRELWSCINHQHSVYSATPAAVPFLAAGAAARVHPARVLGLLAGIASSSDEHGLPPGAARRAVADQAAILDPLLDDDDPAVRGAALRALLESGVLTADRVERRWSEETTPGLLASLLHALAQLDANRAAITAGKVFEPAEEMAPAPVLAVALRLAIRDGARWSPRLADLCESCVGISADDRADWVWNPAPFASLFAAVGECWGVEAALRLCEAQTAWTGPESGSVRLAGVRGLTGLAEEYRSATDPVAERLAGLLDQPELQLNVLRALRGFGPNRVRGAAARLALIAESASDEVADEALRLLVEQEDPRAAGLLAASLERRPRALAAAYHLPFLPAPTAFPFDPALLAAIRARINDLLDHPPAETDELTDPTRRHNEPVELTGLLRGWGPAAAASVPELLRFLEDGRCVSIAALASVGGDRPEILAVLRDQASTGSTSCRVSAAQALERLEGDNAPLAAAIRYALDRDRPRLHGMLDAIDRLGSHVDQLVPALEAAYRRLQDPTRPLAKFNDRALILAALAKGGASPEQTVARYATEITDVGAIRGSWSAWVSFQFIVDTVPVLGSAVLGLVPVLTALLDHPSLGEEALKTLFVVDPRTTSDPELRARHVARLLERLTGERADFRAIQQLAEFGVAELEPGSIEQLRTLMTQDRRTIRAPFLHTAIENDDRWLAELGAVLSEITTRNRDC